MLASLGEEEKSTARIEARAARAHCDFYPVKKSND